MQFTLAAMSFLTGGDDATRQPLYSAAAQFEHKAKTCQILNFFKSKKLTDHSYACNSLTHFWMWGSTIYRQTRKWRIREKRNHRSSRLLLLNLFLVDFAIWKHCAPRASSRQDRKYKEENFSQIRLFPWRIWNFSTILMLENQPSSFLSTSLCSACRSLNPVRYG